MTTLACIVGSGVRMHVYQATVVVIVVFCPDSTFKNEILIPHLPGVLATESSQLSPSPRTGLSQRQPPCPKLSPLLGGSPHPARYKDSAPLLQAGQLWKAGWPSISHTPNKLPMCNSPSQRVCPWEPTSASTYPVPGNTLPRALPCLVLINNTGVWLCCSPRKQRLRDVR